MQLTVNCFLIKQNEQQLNFIDLKKRAEKFEQFELILLVICFSSVKSVYFNQIFCLLCIQAVSDVGPYQTIYWKNTPYRCWTSRACTWTWRETAEFEWEWLFSVCCAHSCQALPLWSELTNNTLRKKDGVHFFSLKFECHNRYNKLLLCNSANDSIAWCNENNSEWVLFSFLKNKDLFLS